MKIALPVDEMNQGTAICASFGRAPYFMIVDTDAQTEAYIDNSAAASQGGAGIKAAQMIVDQGVNVLLTPRCGENAAEVFQGAGIQLFRTKHISAKEAIDAYLKGQLEPLNEIHPGHHHHGDQK